MLNDVIAGVTLALTSIPQAVAYAEVSGVAGWRGLATMGFPCVAFAAATGSPWASIGVTSRQPASGPPPPRRRVSPPGRRRSITAMLARDALAAAHAALPEDDYVLVMAAFATIVGLASTALALCGAGGVAVRRIPGPVKAGFKLGFGCAVVSSQCATASSGAARRACARRATTPRGQAVPRGGGGGGGGPRPRRASVSRGRRGAGRLGQDVAALSAVSSWARCVARRASAARAAGLESSSSWARDGTERGRILRGRRRRRAAGGAAAPSLACAGTFRSAGSSTSATAGPSPRRDRAIATREGDRAGRARSPSRRSSSPPSTSSRACRCAVRSRRKTATRGPVRKSVTRGPAQPRLIESIPRRRGRPTASSRRRASRRSRPARSGAGPAARR